MRDQINKLKDERAQLCEQLRAQINLVESESRDFTSEEQQTYDRMEEDLQALDKRTKRLETLNALEPQALTRSVGPDPEPAPPDEGEPVPTSLAEFKEKRAGVLVQDSAEYRNAFYSLLSVRDTAELSQVELRVLSKATAGAGANLVPTTFERTLLDKAREFGVMRQLATVFTTATGEKIELPTVTSHGSATWTAENAAYTPSDDVFGKEALDAYKATTMMIVSEELLSDAAFDLESYIATEFAARIGVLENTAYMVGDGNGKPTGITTQTTAGKVGTTGQATTITGDDLITLYHSVLSPYRRNAAFVMNDASISAIRKLKDVNTQYLWQPGLQAGKPDTLLGVPVYTDPDMPVMAANAKSVLFGDFSYYRIRDVQGIALQRLAELYAANGQVGFRLYHRTDGKLLNTAAVKHYANSAT